MNTLSLVNGPAHGPVSIFATIIAVLPYGSAAKHAAFCDARTAMVRLGVPYLTACATLNAVTCEARRGS